MIVEFTEEEVKQVRDLLSAQPETHSAFSKLMYPEEPPEGSDLRRLQYEAKVGRICLNHIAVWWPRPLTRGVISRMWAAIKNESISDFGHLQRAHDTKPLAWMNDFQSFIQRKYGYIRE